MLNLSRTTRLFLYRFKNQESLKQMKKQKYLDALDVFYITDVH